MNKTSSQVDGVKEFVASFSLLENTREKEAINNNYGFTSLFGRDTAWLIVMKWQNFVYFSTAFSVLNFQVAFFRTFSQIRIPIFQDFFPCCEKGFLPFMSILCKSVNMNSVSWSSAAVIGTVRNSSSISSRILIALFVSSHAFGHVFSKNAKNEWLDINFCDKK